MPCQKRILKSDACSYFFFFHYAYPRFSFQHELVLFFTAMAVGVPIFVLYSYFREILSIHWREWLTDRILTKYFEKRGFYYLEANGQVDNPDQRIAVSIWCFSYLMNT
jgi:putative ATP-binding cassette transporter